MQSAANVELSPEKDTTMRVASNDFGDGVEGGLRVVGMPWLSVCNGNEGIPSPSREKVDPSVL